MAVRTSGTRPSTGPIWRPEQVVAVTVEGADRGCDDDHRDAAAEELEAVAAATDSQTAVIEEAVANKGYHSNQTLADLRTLDLARAAASECWACPRRCVRPSPPGLIEMGRCGLPTVRCAAAARPARATDASRVRAQRVAGGGPSSSMSAAIGLRDVGPQVGPVNLGLLMRMLLGVGT
jgi:hypothetical protein